MTKENIDKSGKDNNCFGKKIDLSPADRRRLQGYRTPTGTEIVEVVSDMGQINVVFTWSAVEHAMGRQAGLTRKEIKQTLGSLIPLGFEKGLCDEAEFLDKLNAGIISHGGRMLSRKTFEIVWNVSFHRCERMNSAFGYMKERGILLAGLSNANPTHIKRLRELGVYEHFSDDMLVLSCDPGVNSEKPERAIYEQIPVRHAARGIIIEPSRRIFIDDRPDFLKTALDEMGWHIQYLNPKDPRGAARVIRELERLELIPAGVC